MMRDRIRPPYQAPDEEALIDSASQVDGGEVRRGGTPEQNRRESQVDEHRGQPRPVGEGSGDRRGNRSQPRLGAHHRHAPNLNAFVYMRWSSCAYRYALAAMRVPMRPPKDVRPVSARPRPHLRGALVPALRPPRGGIARWLANRYKDRLSKLRT